MSSTSRTRKRLVGVATVGACSLLATPILGIAPAFAAAATVAITSQSVPSASTKSDGTDTNVKISANVVAAIAPDAAVASVRFSYTPTGGSLVVIGTDATAPYSISWTPPAGGGTVDLTAEALSATNTVLATDATKTGIAVTSTAPSVHIVSPAEGGQIGAFGGNIVVSGTRSSDFPALNVKASSRNNTTGVLTVAGAPTAVAATTGGANWSAVVAVPACTAVAPATCSAVITAVATGGSDEVTEATLYAQTLGSLTVSPTSASRPNNGTQDYVATVLDQNAKAIGGVKTTATSGGPAVIAPATLNTGAAGTALYTATASGTAATSTLTFQTATGVGAVYDPLVDFSTTATLTSYAPTTTGVTLAATPSKSLYAAQTEYTGATPVVDLCVVDQFGNGVTASVPAPANLSVTRTRTDSLTVGTPLGVPSTATAYGSGAKSNCYSLSFPAASGTFGQDVFFAYFENNGTPNFQAGSSDLAAAPLTLKYANLAITGLDTQSVKGTAVTVGFKVLGADGSPFVGRKVTLSTPTTATSGFTATQPAGTTAPVAGVVIATTDANGVASASVNSLPLTPPVATPVDVTVDATDNVATVDAPGQVPTSVTTSATVQFRDASVALKTLTLVGGPTVISPAGSPSASPRPGDVVQATYALADVNAGSNLLKNVPVALSLDHGFFTKTCPATTPNTEQYANCDFTTAPAAGGTAGNIKAIGSTTTLTSDASGQVTIAIAIGRDADLDVDGLVPAVLTGVANGGTASPLAAVTTFDTDASAPINGGTVTLVPVLTTTALSGDVQQPKTVRFAVHVTDQFGNLVKLPATSVQLAATGGTLSAATSAGTFTADDATGAGSITLSSTTTSLTGALATVTATFPAPVTTFTDTDPLVTTNFVTVPAGTAVNKTATFTVNFYAIDTANLSYTFASTPGNSVPINTAVTTSVTVKDQKGNAVAALPVQFIRSGPSDAAGNAQTGGATLATNAAGKAGFSFSSGAPGTATITVIVTDGSGNELSRGVQNVTFTSGTPTPTGLSINGPTNNFVKYGTRRFVTGKAAPGAAVTVNFHRAYIAGTTPKPATADANGNWSVVYSAVDDFSYFANVGTAKSATVLTRLDPSVTGINRTVAKGTRITVSGRSGARSLVNVHVGPAVIVVRTSPTGVWSYTFTVTRTVAIFANRSVHNIHTPGITVTAR